jgi:hypothetical protein
MNLLNKINLYHMIHVFLMKLALLKVKKVFFILNFRIFLICFIKIKIIINSGNCKGRSADYTCSAMNTCRTCSTFSENGGICRGLSIFPNATVAEYGSVSGADAMKAEIY